MASRSRVVPLFKAGAGIQSEAGGDKPCECSGGGRGGIGFILSGGGPVGARGHEMSIGIGGAIILCRRAGIDKKGSLTTM